MKTDDDIDLSGAMDRARISLGARLLPEVSALAEAFTAYGREIHRRRRRIRFALMMVAGLIMSCLGWWLGHGGPIS